jgi:hypothetical protein
MGQVRHVSGRSKDSYEPRPKVGGSIAETSCVRNFLGIYEVAVRYGGVQRRIVSHRRAAWQSIPTEHPSPLSVNGDVHALWWSRGEGRSHGHRRRKHLS